MTPELQAQIAVWRRKAADGTITLEEQKQAVIALRAGRKVAAQVSETSRKRSGQAKAEVKSADDMLDELGNI